MRVCFENKSKDLSAEIIFPDKSIITIPPASLKEYELSGDSIIFAVKYVRDFTFGYQLATRVDGKISEQLADKLAEKALASFGNLIVQVINKYKISKLEENSVIELDDRAYYASAEGLEAFFGCFPSLYYFGQAEVSGGEIEIVNSIAFNRPEFLRLYKLIYRTINLHGFIFNIVKYRFQIKRQRKISSSDYLIPKFRELYSLPLDDREYHLKPLTVLIDKFLNFLKGKLPKRVYNKLVRKLKRYF